MADYYWQGSLSTSASTAGNWIDISGTPYGSAPSAGDNIIFDEKGTDNCVWDIAVGAGLSVDETIIENTFGSELRLNTILKHKALFLNGTIASGYTADEMQFVHGASPNFFGSKKSFDERFIMIGDSGVMTNITITMTGSSSVYTKFDDGQHPTVTLDGGKFAPDYKSPTGTSGKASFTSLTINSGTTFEPDGDLVDNDRLKVFSFTASTFSLSTIDFGLSTTEFYATSGGFYLPTYGATGYSSGFQAYYRKIVLKTNTAGQKVLMADNTFVSVEEFEIDDGVVLKGPVADTDQGAEVRSIQPPKIRGTWSFSQISQGIYRSPRHAAGPMAKVNGDFHITGKLDVDGLIDPTGLELDPQATNPGGVAANTLWLNSGDSNKLYLGSSEVAGGGGGGSGTVTSVALSGSDGLEIDSGSPITTSGTIALGVDANALRTHINVENGAEVNVNADWNAGSGDAQILNKPSDVTDLSTHSVTELNDVTNAGSGAVITSAERATLGTALQAETDPVFTASEANLFVAGDASKLAGIEALADVTDATNVEAAGALMDSEIVNLADVKAFDPADYATSGQGTTADDALPKAGGTMTGEIEATTLTLNTIPADPATDTKVRLGESGTSSNMLRIKTDAGYIDIGPNNSGYAHIQTDRNQFYFSKPITYAGNKIYAYSGGMQLGTGNTAASGTTAITVAHGSTDITVAGNIAVGGTVDGRDVAADGTKLDGMKVEIMKWKKTGSANIAVAGGLTLTNSIASGQQSLIDIGSANWVETTVAANHPSITLTPDFGIQFLQGGVYRIDLSLYFYSGAFTGNGLAAMFVSTTVPDISQTGHIPAGMIGDLGYSRTDVYRSNAPLSIDNGQNIVLNISTPPYTVYLYGQGNGASWQIRPAATHSLSDFTVTRLGDAP